MGKIVEYLMTNGEKCTWPIENADDEDLIAEEMRDDWDFVKHATKLRYVTRGELHESWATVWLNKAHIIAVTIKDEEA